MRKLIAVVLVAVAAAVAGPVQAADLIEYPPIEVPEVDYGLEGSFYLRGSVAGNALWARNQEYIDLCACVPGLSTAAVTGLGYGYSFGAGFGYETGTGLRADVTLDHLHNRGLTDGTRELELRSTIVLANAYYDFGLGDFGSAAGGFGAYVGAGIGGGYNWTHVTGPGAGADGGSWAPAGALMTGVTYDMGNMVADLGYRMIYMPQVSNGVAALSAGQSPFYINNAVTHEVRGTLRYRFN